jgi:DNA topoisomerase-3
MCGEIFTVLGKKELKAGFLTVMNLDTGISSADRCVDIPDTIKENQLYYVSDIKLKVGTTLAPNYLSESELIGMMEKHGIGTDASIATHINNIIVRNYASIGPGRTLVPTALGVVLVHGYLRIDPGIFLSVNTCSTFFIDNNNIYIYI